MFAKPGQSKRLVDERLRVFEQIPFLADELRESHIQLLPDDPVPEKIDPVLIRKSSQANCLLSAPLQVGEILYCNLLKDTDEIRIDHNSDHFVGLFILEGVRQIGMALSHAVADIPLDTRMSLQEFSLYFYNYIELDYPIVARAVCTLSLNQDLRTDHMAFIDVRQNGVTCLDIAVDVAEGVAAGQAERAVLVCGTGIGMAIAACKIPGIRAAAVADPYSAERAQKSNNAQVLCLGAKVVGSEVATLLLDHWLDSTFQGGASARKVAKIDALDTRTLA